MDTKKPFFEEEARRWEKNSTSDKTKGKPRLLWAEEFRDGDDGVIRAINAGVFEEYFVNGIPFCKYKSHEHVMEHGKTTSAGVKKAKRATQ